MKNNEKKKDKKPLSYEKKRAIWGMIFLLPWVFGILMFFLGPIVKTFWYSLNNITIGSTGYEYKFAGLSNYKYILFEMKTFNETLLPSLGGVLTKTPLQIFVALFIAMLLNGNYKGRGFFRVVFFIPIILATGITTINLQSGNVAAQESQSFVQVEWLKAIIKMSPLPQQFSSYAESAVSGIMNTLQTAGVQTLIFLAGLQNISPSLYEVAAIEGCSKFESFCKITLPMVSPMILVSMVYTLADNFSTAGISELISKQSFGGSTGGVGAAMSFVYFIVSTTIVVILMKIVSKGVFYYDN